MEVYQPDRKSRGRARERVAARQRKQMATPMATRHDAPTAGRPVEARPPMQRSEASVGYAPAPRPARERRAKRGLGLRLPLGGLWARVGLFVSDVLWYIRSDLRVLLGLMACAGAAVLLVLGITVGQGRIFPNVWALGVPLGGLTTDEAAAALQAAWNERVRIRLVDEDREWDVAPASLGLQLDAAATATAARGVGLAGVPFGYGVRPALSLDMLTAQNTLLNMSTQTDLAPFNAGYRWEGDTLVGVPGANGRYLDVAMTLAAMQEDLAAVGEQQRVDLVMTPAAPDFIDPEPYLAQAQALASSTFLVRGYDPFTDETLAWMPDRDTFTSWLEAGATALSLREGPFASYLDAQSQILSAQDARRYLEPMDAIEQMRSAIEQGRPEATLRIRYRNSTHVVERGDSGYRIARRNGVSFYLMQQANPNRDWDQTLTVGEEITVPSRDLMLPLPPVPNKRIVVDLMTQQLWAFENGQLVFRWLISSGMDQAPTSPGVYQVLSHADVAEGSSVELCGDTSCGTWTMYWFMGIYEAVPGLINGFHGAVLLPGGRYMGGGNVGQPFTYGCVMSQNDNAEQLYRWADEGTLVEILSSEYAPQSELGRQALEMARMNPLPGQPA